MKRANVGIQGVYMYLIEATVLRYVLYVREVNVLVRSSRGSSHTQHQALVLVHSLLLCYRSSEGF